jgi:hypothetical protein
MNTDNEFTGYTLWTTQDGRTWSDHEFPTVSAALQWLLDKALIVGHRCNWRITRDVNIVVGADMGCDDGIDWSRLTQGTPNT